MLHRAAELEGVVQRPAAVLPAITCEHTLQGPPGPHRTAARGRGAGRQHPSAPCSDAAWRSPSHVSRPPPKCSYDSNGNRTSLTTALGTVSSSYDAQDRLTRSATSGGVVTLYAYGSNGELQTKTDSATGAQTRYQYDALGNLLTVVLPTGDSVEYLVDGQNRRVGRKLNGAVTHRWLYQNQLNPIAELDSAGALVSRFVYGSRGNVPDYLVRGGAVYRLVPDHLGSVRTVVDTATGAVAQWTSYDAWGNVLADSGAGFQPFGFAGGLTDGATGLVRFGVRDYDPTIGRWTAKDPVGFGGGAENLIAYADGDPVNLSDPTGTDWLSTAANFAAGFGDNVTFGLTDWARNQIGVNGAIDRSSSAYSGGEWTGTAATLALGAVAATAAAEKAAAEFAQVGFKKAGVEFSHWIPDRLGGPRSLWNGNVVSVAEHALSDPYRYRFMARAWKALNPLPNALIRQWRRLPAWVPGAGRGGLYSLISRALQAACR
ncbi:MAG: hypothetical protein IPO73_19070 [Gemmatimonadetes bacterium]|nr:hypothetical protein [Gemmatimonadota bacterium]